MRVDLRLVRALGEGGCTNLVLAPQQIVTILRWGPPHFLKRDLPLG